MAELVIARGLPGSGKSTLARECYPNHLHYEPDHLFRDTQGRYRFDAQLWQAACQWVWQMADFALARGEDVIVTDVLPLISDVVEYEALAYAHDATFKVVDCGTEFGSVHRVPITVIRRMRDQWQPWEEA